MGKSSPRKRMKWKKKKKGTYIHECRTVKRKRERLQKKK